MLSDQAMRRFNKRYAGKDSATDVLSFQAEWDEEEPYLGDILISAETAERQRKARLETELQILALHGVLHLMGYDHEIDDGEMAFLEKELRQEFELE